MVPVLGDGGDRIVVGGKERPVAPAPALSIEQLEPGCILLDIRMPGMDGYELVRRLRQDDRTAHTSVIFCSASYHEREVREMARSQRRGRGWLPLPE